MAACETPPRDFGSVDAAGNSTAVGAPTEQHNDAGTTDVSTLATTDPSVDTSTEAGSAVAADSSERADATSTTANVEDSTRGPDTSLTTDAESSETTLTCDGCTIDGACVVGGTANPDNPCLACDPEQSTTDWVSNDKASCSDGVYCNGDEVCSQGTCLSGTPPCDAQYCDEPGAHCCEPTNQVACGPSGNVHFLDTCGGFGEVSHSCSGACVDGSCRCIVYVNSGGSDDNDGRSWAGAKRSVGAGIAAASVDGCEVWVRSGTYTPGFGRTATFQLAPNVAVFGGFSGTETRQEQRDWQANVTVLSGEVGLSAEDVSDNAYHVVTGANHALLDGFTITQGNANGATRECGGGVLNEGVSPTLRNLVFDANVTFSSGADICNIDASPVIEHVSLANSRATSSGGGYGVFILQQGGRAVLRHARFTGGTSTRGVGRGIANEGELLIANSEFRNLAMRDGGGAILNTNGARLTLRDCLFDGNSVSASSVGAGGGAIESSGILHIVNSTFSHNTAGFGGAIAAVAGSVEVVGTRFTNNSTGSTSGGAIAVVSAAVTITNSLFAGNAAKEYQGVAGVGGAIYVGGGGLTLVNSTFVNNTATPAAGEGGGGALHFGANSINSVSNCLFWNNSSVEGDDLYIDGSAVLLLGRNTYSAGMPCHPDRNCASVDPEFVPDLSLNGDFTPSATSGCRELGEDAVLPQDTLDVDGDLDVAERLPVDLLGRPRVVGTVDVGAFEGQ